MAFLSDQFFHSTLSDWIADVKLLFYGALAYAALGLAGLLGAVFGIGVLLWLLSLFLPFLSSHSYSYSISRCSYAPYLLVGACLGAYKVYTVFETVIAAESDLEEAWCVFFLSSAFLTSNVLTVYVPDSDKLGSAFNVSCDSLFDKIKEYTYGVNPCLRP
jgi:hypothetical protein